MRRELFYSYVEFFDLLDYFMLSWDPFILVSIFIFKLYELTSYPFKTKKSLEISLRYHEISKFQIL
jgi:hypothetical protein